VYQREEIRALREMLGGKRLRFTDAQRRRLALKARLLSHGKFANTPGGLENSTYERTDDDSRQLSRMRSIALTHALGRCPLPDEPGAEASGFTSPTSTSP